MMSFPLQMRRSIASASLLATLAPAQRWIEPCAGLRETPFGTAHVMSVVDLDGDGNSDFVWSSPTSERVQMGLGGGLFADHDPLRLPFWSETAKHVFFDADRDGDLDFLRLRGRQSLVQSLLFENDGAGRFANVTQWRIPVLVASSFDGVAGDVDNDGDQDLVISSNLGLALWQNDGTGSFTEVTATHLVAPLLYGYQLALGDLDGDRDLDLVVADTRGTQRSGLLWRNDGTGRFADVTATHDRSGGTGRGQFVVLLDFEADGDLDIVLGGSWGLELRVNDGSGRFDAFAGVRPPLPTNYASSLFAADLDGDGDRDLLFLGQFSTSGSNRGGIVWRNDGALRFTEVGTALSLPARIWAGGALEDVDGDRRVDLIVGWRAGSLEVLKNDGLGSFPRGSREVFLPEARGMETLASADVDGDGDFDVVTADLSLAFNDGRGRFTRGPSISSVSVTESARHVVFADIEADGDLDLFVAHASRSWARLFRGDGTGAFTEDPQSSLPLFPNAYQQVRFADLDLDGDPDLLHAGPYGGLYWRNDGTGRFAQEWSVFPTAFYAIGGVAAGDLDGDGDLDLVTSEGTRLRLALGNVGATAFVDASSQMPVVSGPGQIELVDMDADGDLDLLVAVSTGVAYLRNDGQARFRVLGPILGGAGVDRFLVRDLDEDGDADLLIARLGPGRTTQLWMNDGSGRFLDRSTALPPDEDRSGLAAFDADADGDVEIFVGRAGEGARYWKSLTRELQEALPPRLGRTAVLDFYAKPGFAPSATSVGILAAPRDARISLGAIGTLGLDPASLFLVAKPSIPIPGGRYSLLVPVPLQLELLGASYGFQATHLDADGLRLGNALFGAVR